MEEEQMEKEFFFSVLHFNSNNSFPSEENVLRLSIVQWYI